MKTTKTKKQSKLSTPNNQESTKSELLNRTEQLSENTGTETPTSDLRPQTSGSETPNSKLQAPGSIRPYVNFAERDFNRKLSVDKVLTKLRRWMPGQYELAEVVGKWVWISFPQPPLERVRADLSQLGFHWNNTRKCWQHPCGETLPRGQQEPREKYSVWFPSALSRRSAAKADATEPLRQRKAQRQSAEVPFDREPAAA